MKKGKLIIISGPSQVGKDTIINELLKDKSLKIKRITTETTRPRRTTEKDIGLNFVSNEEFDRKLKENYYLEWAPVRNYKFGSPKKVAMDLLKKGYNVILRIDVRGKKQVLEKMPATKTIFLMPGDMKEIIGRLKDIKTTDDQIKIRLTEAKNEIKESRNYDYVIVNPEGKLSQTIEKVRYAIYGIIREK